MKHTPPVGAVMRARRLRRDMTDAERAMWLLLRKAFANTHFRRQVPIRHFIADFASHQVKLIIEVDGNSEDGLLAELSQASDIATAFGALETLVAQDESQREKLWAARRMVSTSLRAMTRHKISEDVCVPRSKIPEAIARFKALGREHGLIVATYGHAGDGNLHANVLYDTPADRPRVNLVLEAMMRLTVELGGTITGEHGVGVAKRDFLAFEQRHNVIELQKRLKVLFDPQGLMNPGKIF